MSPVQDVVWFGVQTYLQHYGTPEDSTLLTTDAALPTQPEKDSMVEVLKNLQSLVNKEITKQLTDLKRRRNQEHAPIYRLPQEVFVAIMLEATSFASNITDTFTLMKVSKYWFDAVAQCPHIWSRFNVVASPQPGIMTMMRALRGPVEVQCNWEPELGLDDSIAKLSTLDPTRFRALVWYWSEETEAMHSFFRERNSYIVDLAADRATSYSPQRRLDLSPEGLCLRHLDLRRVALPWTSPRLSGLRTLSIQYLHYEHPSSHDLYRILSASPALRRIRIDNFYDANQGQHTASPAITEPVFLPELSSLQLTVPSIIIYTLVPLIRSPSCQYLNLHPVPQKPLERLEPSDAILDLITHSVTSQSLLDILVEDISGELSVSLASSLRQARNTWGDWDNPDTGIGIRLFPPTMKELQNLFDGLISRLEVACWKPETLDLSFNVSGDDTSDTETLTFPEFLFSFPLPFQTIRRLDLALPSSSTYCSALRLLADEIPRLTSLIMYNASDGFSCREEWANGIKAFLERRYPLRPQADSNVSKTFSRLAKIYVPKHVAECLRRQWPVTSLSMEEVLSNLEDRPR